MTNGDRIRQMSDEELVHLIMDEPWCTTGEGCPEGNIDCHTCLHSFMTSSDKADILESKLDGFFDCNMRNCTYAVNGKCTNSCYLDCPYYSLRQSLRELVKKYEEIVCKI